MPWNLLLLPLIGGYYIISRLNYFKFKQQRLERQRLIFDSTIIAIILVCVTFLIRAFFDFFFPETIHSIYQYIPYKQPLIGTAFFSFLFAVLITEILNYFFYHNINNQVNKAIEKVGNELELMFANSYNNFTLLQFTLDNNKFYIGQVKELPIPNVTNHIKIIPIFSGFRDEKKQLIFTTEYLPIYDLETKTLDNSMDVEILITIDNVVTVSKFDSKTYELFNNSDKT